MEKEQKKLVLVAVSVGVFLLVTITAAIIIITPKAPAEGAAFSSSRPYTTGRTQPAVENVNILPPPAVNTEAPVNAEVEKTQTAAADKADGDNLTISIPRPTTAAVPDNPDTPASAAPRPVVTAAPAKPAAPAAPRPAAATATAARPASTAAPRPASTAAARPAPKTTNDYWVQTGAFTARIRAEDAKELLASKGITSIIENRQLNGQTWYRVRLGPYTSENEANYWLTLVKTIDGFSESQVRQTVRQQ